MGWFGFFKGKSETPDEAERRQQSETQSLAATTKRLFDSNPPRLWHYFVTHIALRDVALKGSEVEAAMADPSRVTSMLGMVLSKMAPHLELDDGDAARHAASLSIEARRFRRGSPGFVVTMPRPEVPSETHFAAVVAAAPGGSDGIRYFTLDDAGGGVACLCEWTADDDHHLFGECPADSVDDFVAAINEKL